MWNVLCSVMSDSATPWTVAQWTLAPPGKPRWEALRYPSGPVVKNPPANAGDIRDVGLIPGLGRSPGWYANPLQYSCLQNLMNRGAWWAIVHKVAKSQTWLKPLSTHTHIITKATRQGLKSQSRSSVNSKLTFPGYRVMHSAKEREVPRKTGRLIYEQQG